MATARFARITPSAAQIMDMDDYRQAFADIEADLNRGKDYDPRYRALALTYLEIAAMFVNKAITHVGD